ncbi:hypothetical protein QT381_09540 [Galbitalea sp. SE-J8]|uniref:hypothetical protein n=1 Tax=Galbitalea sp. SE-J8 TaxID=3054952 RepID=UPI00259CCFB8|nr:hypothetical protein [Galbitalea sp. SE-J8]MDM4763248.1 hypothetical protein [Galbitalea sp. SE-J8]
MKNVLVFVLGATAGFVAAHFVSRTPQGKQFLDEVDARVSEFVDAVVDGYKVREAELKSTIAEAQDVIADAANRGD